ncbi:MAG TPA: carboxypeptidase-like regulatory domain-containing protein, partial [Nitrospira sp.]|nr:carboxypeptidase-like regulatory domain-containing protein [Nitrospira sp.]
MNSSTRITQQFSLRTRNFTKRVNVSTSPGLAWVTPILTVWLVAAFATTMALGQSYYGGLRGVVRDPDGSVVANAKVTLVDQATRLERLTYSSGEGVYYFNQIVPGTYSISTEAAGFKKFEQRDVIIATQQQVSLDLALQIGEITQTVEVRTEVPLIEYSNASQGQVLDNKQLRELPNFGRNPYGMSRITQNVTPVGNPATNNMQTQSATALTT